MASIEFFTKSEGIQVEKMTFVTNVSSPVDAHGPLESRCLCTISNHCHRTHRYYFAELRARIAPGAIHDSAERCDAPKCQEHTRVAVQDDLYDWLQNGDGEPSEQLSKIKWITGPAGSGKTAIMGSLSERCKGNGLLAATFFCASLSALICRQKTALVTTIAHQLAQYHPSLRDEISKSVDANLDIFDKNLHAQMEVLVLTPLRAIQWRNEGSVLQGAIIIDGLDECEARQQNVATPTSQSPPTRRDEQDQLEILQVLQMASSDPSFPFRILIASRPEPVFREFFDPITNPSASTFAPKLDLHQEYNADADIKLFYEAQLSLLRRRYNLPLSWPLPESIRVLVANASGQFIYASIIIRFLQGRHREPPEVLLDAILKSAQSAASGLTAFEPLDALYAHILKSSPDPPLSMRWVQVIKMIHRYMHLISGFNVVSNVNTLLQTDQNSGEAEHLLGCLHSLISIPPPHEQTTTSYKFYHKSLLDFLDSPDRSGDLFISHEDSLRFFGSRFNQACTSESTTFS
ncbi:hypothetical protein MD484_g8660, partial [Candolleomyces efflorescens]